MPFTVSTVEGFDLRSLRGAAAELDAKIDELDELIAEQRRSVRRLHGAWRGVSGEVTVAQAEQHLVAQVRLRGRLEAVRRTLDSGSAQLAEARDGLTGLVETLRESGWTVTDAGHAIAPQFPTLLRQFEPGFTALIRRLLHLFDQIDAGTAAGLSSALR